MARRTRAPFPASLAQQPALSAVKPDRAVLGGQYRARALCRRPHTAADALLRQVDRGIFHAAAIRAATPQARLAGTARSPALDRRAVGNRFRLQQRPVLLGA